MITLAVLISIYATGVVVLFLNDALSFIAEEEVKDLWWLKNLFWFIYYPVVFAVLGIATLAGRIFGMYQ